MFFIGLLPLGIVTLFASLYILLSILTGADTSISDLVPISILLIGLIIGLYTVCTVYLFHQIMKRLHSIVRKKTDCKSQNYIVIPRRHRNAIFISFIYYDMKPCWNYLEQRAREYWPDDTEEDIAKKCNEELVTTILGSFKGLDLNAIPQAAPIRHNTYQNRCCLCFVAQSSWTKGKSALNVIPEQCLENQNEETCVMKIAESETDHETFVKKALENEHFESTEGNDETSVMKILCNIQESISSYSPGAGAVSGSPLTEAGSGLPLAEAVGCTSLRGAEGGTSLTEAASGLPLTGAEGGTSLRGAVGGTSLTEAEGGSLLDSNIDRWYGDMCETRVRGEASSTQQPQVSHELITWGENPVNLTDSVMSTSFNDLEEAVPLQSGDEELQWFRGEHDIDEATHAKVPR
ncbi:uncharacterized protein LOC110441694 isoform X1 [Mizuhopecten yessoensis]|uniref:uncharacterized protein LOC110441694 isoform X1 n=1 Tax=Mizuhopecten yessoensis TaxID=6573 RepID=UPI000B45E36F|nr:uncharacterized protein LOC110441694 isoform X1 [Mizuhopecten yessoensis]XP_021340587.1 uncharacterized protein LOC110441694 isoform X1 [Mizuhopecten yessoensis]XP_021340588.1 uncharacterized protein LOC110441694 isoform X1 [Mizuhopecten yessoensis]